MMRSNLFCGGGAYDLRHMRAGPNEKAVYKNTPIKMGFLIFIGVFLSLFLGVEATCRDEKSKAF